MWPSWAEAGALVLAAAALIGAIGTMARTLTEVRGMRDDQERLRAEQATQGRAVGVIEQHVANTHATNLRDDIDQIGAAISRVDKAGRRHDRELGRLADIVEHLASVDAADRDRADKEHTRMWETIERIVAGVTITARPKRSHQDDPDL